MTRFTFGLIALLATTALPPRAFADTPAGPARSEPVDVTADEIYRGKHVGDRVRFTGTVVDAFRDEANPDYTFIVLASGRDTLYLPSTQLTDDDLHGLIDATVTIVGTGASYRNVGPRARLGFEVNILDRRDIVILKPAPSDPFNVPVLGGSVHDVWQPKPNEARRRRLLGTVEATWQGDRILLRTGSDETSVVELAGSEPPAVGESIEVVGLPETDFYHLNLSRAIWRPTDAPAIPDPEPESVTAEFLLTDGEGRRKYNVEYHGRIIRLSGIVRNLPGPNGGNGIMHLKCGDFLVPVDASSAPAALARVQGGCKVQVTGACVMETDNWRPQAPFPHIRVMTVVLRTADDVHILAYPPWWTISRLLIVLGSLLALLVAILIWNTALRKLIIRKGHELMREQLQHEKSKAKADERTRLAIELHDTISQNLTGISMQIDAAANFIGDNREKALKHLDIASRTLDSCRGELRNCIWDLRNGSLDAGDLDSAIRNALVSHLGDARLSLDIDIPRKHLADNFTHTLIRIVRELATNAVRHGHARTLDIVGRLADGRIRVSVSDDGAGFDPAHCPGVSEGHFGLEGIRERISEYKGTLSVDSAVGKGTRAVVCLVPPEHEKGSPQ